MRASLILALALPLSLSLGVPAVAASHKAATHNVRASTSPKELGKFGDWTAAVYEQSGKKICYAFTNATSSSPTLPDRGSTILTVTERSGTPESIALEAGFTYAPKATVTVVVDDHNRLDFYTAAHNAFARDSKAAITAFERGRTAAAHSPAPNGKEVVDTFSLHGFSDAHNAVVKACPGK